MAKSSGGIDLGTLIELAGVVLNSTKNKAPGPDGLSGGFGIDFKKLGWGLSGVGSQFVFRWWNQQRENKALKRELAAGLITQPDFEAGNRYDPQKKKKNSFGPGMLAGTVVGGALYLLSMPPEQRQAFFKQLDRTFNQLSGILNELQGKPYSKDYEPKVG